MASFNGPIADGGSVNFSLRSKLKKRNREFAERVARSLLPDPFVLDEDALKNLEASTKALKALESRGTMAAALGVATVCVLVVGILWAVRLPRTHLAAALESDTVSFELRDDWLSQPLPASEVRLDALARIESPALGLSVESQSGDAWLRTRGDHILLERLTLNKSTHVTVVEVEDRLDLFAADGRAGGSVVVGKGDMVHAGGRPSQQNGQQVIARDAVPESIEVLALARGRVPTRVTLKPRGTWALKYIPVRDIRFFRDRPPQTTATGLLAVMSEAFESSIKGGTVTLYDVPQMRLLRETDRLRLDQAVGSITMITSTGKGMKVVFEGTARSIVIGPEGAETNLAPSLLEYLYHREPLTFLWGGVTFGWAFLWGARKIFAAGPQ
jgi:hypothetical protein